MSMQAVDRDTTLLLWGEQVVQIKRDDETGRVEIVAHPSPAMDVSFRQAREPYECTLHLADGRQVDVDLACSEDWGDIQTCFPDECRKWPALGWGNDSDGHVEIVKVTLDDGTVVPMAEFERDVKDFIVHHEA